MLSNATAVVNRYSTRTPLMRGTLGLRPSIRRTLLLLIVFIFMTAVMAPQYVAQAAPPGQSPGDGQTSFNQKCAACHTVGGGDGAGPDLAGVTTRRTNEWLTRWIAEPDVMLEEGDPIATELLQQFSIPMPNLRLDDAEVASLVAYLESTAGGAAPAPISAAPIAATSGGDANVGKNLFTGATRLQNGGPSCRACHTASGIGAFGGGALGPDLTGVYGRLGDGTIGMPMTGTMAPIFSNKVLTPDEQANLLAFFKSAGATQRPSQAVWQLTGLAVVGIVVFAIVIQLIWRHRLVSVRKTMVSGQASRK